MALVTGGGCRVGLAISQALLTAGFDLAVHYHSSSSQLESLARLAAGLDQHLATFPADFTQVRAPDELAERCLSTFGRLDLLVNNAAIFLPDDSDAIALAKMKLVNVDAPQRLIDGLAARLAKSRGSVVNIADVAGLSPLRRHRAYSRSKEVLIERTRAAALRLANSGVRVNCVCPGTVLPAVGYEGERLAALIDAIPLRRCGEPSDVARAVVFLAEATFITGQVLCVDGGRSLIAPRGRPSLDRKPTRGN